MTLSAIYENRWLRKIDHQKTFFFSISSFRLFPGDKAIYENLYFEKSIIDIKMDKNANFCFLQYLSTKQKKITTNKQVVTKLR